MSIRMSSPYRYMCRHFDTDLIDNHRYLDKKGYEHFYLREILFETETNISTSGRPHFF